MLQKIQKLVLQNVNDIYSYILYLPIKPWIWISKEAFGSLQRLYSGTIVPL